MGPEPMLLILPVDQNLYKAAARQRKSQERGPQARHLKQRLFPVLRGSSMASPPLPRRTAVSDNVYLLRVAAVRGLVWERRTVNIGDWP